MRPERRLGSRVRGGGGGAGNTSPEAPLGAGPIKYDTSAAADRPPRASALGVAKAVCKLRRRERWASKIRKFRAGLDAAVAAGEAGVLWASAASTQDGGRGNSASGCIRHEAGGGAGGRRTRRGLRARRGRGARPKGGRGDRPSRPTTVQRAARTRRSRGKEEGTPEVRVDGARGRRP